MKEKPNYWRQTDGRTDGTGGGQTDKVSYRGATLLKSTKIYLNNGHILKQKLLK